MTDSKQKGSKEQDELEPGLAEDLPEGYEEVDEEPDDAVIGRALRGSLAVLLVVLVIAAAAYFLTRGSGAAAPEQDIENAAPQAVAETLDLPDVAFADVTQAAGIDFVHFNGATGDKLLPESMGSGAAFFDYDNDGDPDLLLVNSSSWPWADAAGPAPSLR